MIVKPKHIKKEIEQIENLGLNKDELLYALGKYQKEINNQIKLIKNVLYHGVIAHNKMKRIVLIELLADYKGLLLQVENKIRANGGA